jgi:hypothetical protein
VIVPVLSITTVSTICAVSNASPDLIRIPFSAPFPVPTIIATGVASPSAHGQEITRTAIPQDIANSKSAPLASQTMNVTIAIPITVGTKTPAILSARRAIGALLEDASSTRLMICAIVVSLPTRVARAWISPALLIDADMTLSPSCFNTGILSPVIADSSKEDFPSTITPSTATDSPGLITKISPCTTSAASMTCSFPSRTTVTVFGAKFISFVIASLVFPFDFVSRYFPTVISVRIVPADSK